MDPPKKTLCCIRGCKSNLTIKHSSFYQIRPEWLETIISYARKRGKSPRESRSICGKHVHLCGLRGVFNKRLISFPFLKISVSTEKRPEDVKELELGDEVMMVCDDLDVGAEVVYPNLLEEANCLDTLKERRFLKRLRLDQDHYDHSYALSEDYIQKVKEDYEKTKDKYEQLMENNKQMVDHYNKELERLRKINHDLMKISFHNELGSQSFKRIMDNERMLKIYTGFPDRVKFYDFASMLRPPYELARTDERKRALQRSRISFEDQLVLTLARLRLGLMQNDLAYRFNISAPTICSMWTFWLNFLSTKLAEESLKLHREKKNAQSSQKHRIILECHETLFENATHDPNCQLAIDQVKTYVRAKGLIEVTGSGYVSFVSDLYPTVISDQELLDKCCSPAAAESGDEDENCQVGYAVTDRKGKRGGRIGRFTSFQTHVQRILYCVKGYKIIKGVFPNATYSLDQLNLFWKICCFLINFINKPLEQEQVDE